MSEKVKGMYGDLYFENLTHKEIADTLNKAFKTQARVKITYKEGYGKIGGYSPILEETFCYIGRSMGPQCIPLEILSKRSDGGGAIMIDCIKEIEIR